MLSLVWLLPLSGLWCEADSDEEAEEEEGEEVVDDEEVA